MTDGGRWLEARPEVVSVSDGTEPVTTTFPEGEDEGSSAETAGVGDAALPSGTPPPEKGRRGVIEVQSEVVARVSRLPGFWSSSGLLRVHGIGQRGRTFYP